MTSIKENHELQEKELDKIIEKLVDIKSSIEDFLQKASKINESFSIKKLKNNKKSLRLVSNNKIDINVLVRLALR